MRQRVECLRKVNGKIVNGRSSRRCMATICEEVCSATTVSYSHKIAQVLLCREKEVCWIRVYSLSLTEVLSEGISREVLPVIYRILIQ